METWVIKYKRTSVKVTHASDQLHRVEVKVPASKNNCVAELMVAQDSGFRIQAPDLKITKSVGF